MKKKVFNLIILDASGSMCSIEKATVSGLNETIQSIKHAQTEHPKQKHFVTLMSFNSNGQVYHLDRKPANDIELFDGKDYDPNSCTPLYDAIGSGIALLLKFRFRLCRFMRLSFVVAICQRTLLKHVGILLRSEGRVVRSARPKPQIVFASRFQEQRYDTAPITCPLLSVTVH